MILLSLAIVVQIGMSNSVFAASKKEPGPKTQVTVNHSTGTVSVKGLLELLPGEQITFTVIETKKACFLYNDVPVTREAQRAVGTEALRASDVVEWPDDHQRDVTKYRIEITSRPGADAEACKGLEPLTKEISVVTLGWEVGLAGAFTVDGLRSPEYFLAPQAGTDPQAYVVTRDRDAEDKYNNDLAIMIHLYNSASFRDSSIAWAPLTFGVGFGDTTRYMVGTSAKFGDAFFLTGGYLIGKVDRLPTGMDEGTVTTDPNAIKSGSQKTDGAWFVGFSYKFLSTGSEDRLKALFGSGKEAAPQPKAANTEPD
jgi:hypothetical protein